MPLTATGMAAAALPTADFETLPPVAAVGGWAVGGLTIRPDGIIAQLASAGFTPLAGSATATVQPDARLSPASAIDASANAPPTTYVHRLLARTDQLGDGLSLISATFDFVGEGRSDEADFGALSSGLSVAANAVAVVDKHRKGELFPAIAAWLKFTGGVASLADKYVFPGTPYLATTAGALKLSAQFVKFVDPAKSD